MSLIDDKTSDSGPLFGDFSGATEKVRGSTNALGISAASFSKAMSKAFTDATTGGKQFDDVLKQLGLRLSNMAVTQAFQPLAKNLTSGLGALLGDVFGSGSGGVGKTKGSTPGELSFMDNVTGLTPFASGGVIGAPAYFPMASGGLGLAGEAGPEAIVPLARGSDGRLGVAMSGAGQMPNITVQIATPDAGSFRRSEAYITGQIARAVARGQRGF
ncbi:MAG TPA: phage tail tape measure protein [Pseudolabrys sp.]|jgi:phage-related minor tail protein|nr:phage tail tape measure protein [Pseudolabrys sp.]